MKVDLGLFLLIEGFIIILFLLWRLFKKTEKQEALLLQQENLLQDISEVIEISNNRLKEIDEKGSFESDDEIGWFFKNLKEIQEELNSFKLNRRYGR